MRFQVGDPNGYRRICRRILKRFANQHEIMLANVVETCLLVPDGIPKQEIPTAWTKWSSEALADDASPDGGLNQSGPNGPFADLMLFCKGLIHYRAGNFAQAADWFRKSREKADLARGPRPDILAGRRCRVLTALFLVMTEHRRGHTEEAQRQLQEAVVMIDQQFPQGPNEIGDGWSNWLRCDIVRREAEALLEGDEKPVETVDQPLSQE